MSIKLKLIVVLSALACALILIGGAGYHGLRQMSARTQTIVLDRVLPLEQLTSVRTDYLSVADRTLKVAAGTGTADAAAQSIAASRAAAAKDWAAYLATYLTPEEAGIADQTKMVMAASQAELVRLEAILRGGDPTAIAGFARSSLDRTIDPVVGKLSALVDLQVRVANEEFQAAEAISANMTLAMAALAGLSLAAPAATTFFLACCSWFSCCFCFSVRRHLPRQPPSHGVAQRAIAP